MADQAKIKVNKQLVQAYEDLRRVKEQTEQAIPFLQNVNNVVSRLPSLVEELYHAEMSAITTRRDELEKETQLLRDERERLLSRQKSITAERDELRAGMEVLRREMQALREEHAAARAKNVVDAVRDSSGGEVSTEDDKEPVVSLDDPDSSGDTSSDDTPNDEDDTSSESKDATEETATA